MPNLVNIEPASPTVYVLVVGHFSPNSWENDKLVLLDRHLLPVPLLPTGMRGYREFSYLAVSTLGQCIYVQTKFDLPFPKSISRNHFSTVFTRTCPACRGRQLLLHYWLFRITILETAVSTLVFGLLPRDWEFTRLGWFRLLDLWLASFFFI